MAQLDEMVKSVYWTAADIDTDIAKVQAFTRAISAIVVRNLQESKAVSMASETIMDTTAGDIYLLLSLMDDLLRQVAENTRKVMDKTDTNRDYVVTPQQAGIQQKEGIA